MELSITRLLIGRKVERILFPTSFPTDGKQEYLEIIFEDGVSLKVYPDLELDVSTMVNLTFSEGKEKISIGKSFTEFYK